MIRSMCADTIEEPKNGMKTKARAEESRKEITKRYKERRTKGLYNTMKMNITESGCVKAQPFEEQWKLPTRSM